MSRQSSLAALANAFGQCVALSIPTPNEAPRSRLRKIARLVDRLARRPATRTWHRRVARIHREIEMTLRGQKSRIRSGSNWAAV